MRHRCINPNNRYFNDYGGRGIKCLWNDFEEFAHDMYVLYVWHVMLYGEENTTIERINNDGNYCKENCRWATKKEQQNNTRNNKIFCFDNKCQTLMQWSEEQKISYPTLWHRIFKFQWSVEKALITPPLKY